MSYVDGLRLALLRSDVGLFKLAFNHLWNTSEGQKDLKKSLPVMVADVNWPWLGAWSELVIKCRDDKPTEKKQYGNFLYDLLLSTKSRDVFWINEAIRLNYSLPPTEANFIKNENAILLPRIPRASESERLIGMILPKGRTDWNLLPIVKYAAVAKNRGCVVGLQLIALRGLPTKEEFEKERLSRRVDPNVKVRLPNNTHEDLPWELGLKDPKAWKKCVEAMAQYLPKVDPLIPSNPLLLSEMIRYLGMEETRFQVPIGDRTKLEKVTTEHTLWLYLILDIMFAKYRLPIKEGYRLWRWHVRDQWQHFGPWAVKHGT